LPESKPEAEKRHLRELEGKNVQHYTVLLSAWIQTRMERDKTLVALSAGGIGLLVTILTAVGLPSLWMILLYLGAFSGFFVTIWTSIKIYQLNSEKLEHELRGYDSPTYKSIDLEPYDRRSFLGFALGALFAIAIGVSSAILAYLGAEEPHVSRKTQEMKPQEVPERRSLDGIEKLRPQAPQPVQPTTPPEPTSTPADTSATPNESSSD